MFRRDVLRTTGALGLVGSVPMAWAHHGWSSFDQERPIYLAGRAVEVKWRNPHVELVLELKSLLTLPADLAKRTVPAQSAQVDGRGLLGKAVLPTRRDRRWEIELAPLSRVGQWQVPEVGVGTELEVLGFTFTGEKGSPLLRAEYLFLGGKTYGMRSSPA